MDEITQHHLLWLSVFWQPCSGSSGELIAGARLLALWQDRYGPTGRVIWCADRNWDTIQLFSKKTGYSFADKFVFVLAPAIVAISY